MRFPALRSLRALTAAFLILFLAITGGTGFAIYSTTLSAIDDLVDRRIAYESGELAPPGTPRKEVIRRIESFTRTRETGDLGLLLLDQSGRPIAGNVLMNRRLSPGYSTLGLADYIQGLTHGRAFVRRLQDGTTLITLAETQPVDDYLPQRARIYIIGFAAIIAIVIGGVLVFSMIISRRIGEMHRTVEAIIDGDMRRRIPRDGSHSEFDRQAAAFNRMLDRIGQLMEEIRHVSGTIAHELRTPLARLRNRLSLLENRLEDGPTRDQVGTALDDADTLLEMFAAMLRIIEIEGGERRARFTPIDLGTLAFDVGSMMEPVARESGHALHLRPADGIGIQGDQALLTQMLVNLIENALKHCPSGTDIAIEVRQDGAHAVIAVTDNGPGIAPADREEALRRFGRLQHDGAGHGLGLPLVAAIARLHRGTILLEDAAPGLRVLIRLPLE